MRVQETTVYTFDELSDESKLKAIGQFRDINVDDYDWYNFVYDDAIAIGSLMGIEIDDINFALFQQGDGALFIGKYAYCKNSVNLVKQYAPTDTVLHEIVEKLYEIQKHANFKLAATIKRNGLRYSHNRAVDIRISHDDDMHRDEWLDKSVKNHTVGQELEHVLRQYMDWIYDKLYQEYEYSTGNECVADTIVANEYEFTIDGKRYI